jgi:hypothetical protein
VLDAPGDFAPFDLFLGQVDNRFVRAGFVQQPHRRAHCAAELAFAKVALLAQADEQHPVGEGPPDIVQK